MDENFVVFVGCCKQVSVEYVELCRDSSLPEPFQFVIHTLTNIVLDTKNHFFK